MKYKKIIFVSLDNTYTSVAAEYIAKKLIKENDLNIEVCSRGMVVLFPEPVNSKGVAIGKSRGYNMEEHMSQELTVEDFDVETLVLVMTEKISEEIYEKYADAMNVYIIKKFIGSYGNIEAPYGKSLQDYGEDFSKMEKIVEGVVSKIIEMEKE